MAANTRADAGNFGQLPTFGDSAVPQSPDVNSYSDRQTARLAGEPGETQQRVFQGLSDKLGGMVDQAVAFEGKQAGLVAGTDPNYRPNADESIRGRAFTEAANQTYLNSVDAQSKQQASQAYSDWLQLPPGQRQPGALNTSLQKIQDDFTANHVFPEIQGEFVNRFSNLATAYQQSAQRDFEKQVHDNAQASFLQSNAANMDSARRIYATGLDSNAPEAERQKQQMFAGIDGAVAKGAITPQEGFLQKQSNAQDLWVTDKVARFLATPDAEKQAYIDGVNQSFVGPQALSNPQAGQASAPLAERNNNFTNIRDGAYARAQPGYVGADNGFARFATPEDGLRAANHNLDAYAAQGLNTVNGIISRWTPPSENDTARAIAQASSRLGVGPDQKIDMNDPAVRANLLHVIVQQETGKTPFAIPDIQRALTGSTDGGTVAALDKFNAQAGGVLRGLNSQQGQVQKEALANIGAATKQEAGGIAVPDKQWQSMASTYAGSPDPVVAQAYQSAVGVHTFVTGLRAMKPDEVEAKLANMQGAPDAGADPQNVLKIDAGQNYLKHLREDLQSDPLSRAAKDGTIRDLQALDTSSPQALQSSLVTRQAQAAQVADHYGVAPKMLMQNERGMFKTIAINGGPPMVAAAGAVTQALGPDAGQFFREVGNDAPNFALAGKLAAGGGDPQFTKDLAERARLNNDPTVKGALETAPKSAIEPQLNSIYGDALRMLPEFAAQAANGARQVHELHSFAARTTPDPTSADFTMAAQNAVGARFDGAEQYGGVASYKTSFLGGGQKVLIPSGMRADQFGAAIGAVSDTDLKGLPAPPVAADGKTPVPASMIKNGYLAAVGDGKYAVSMQPSNSPDPQWVRDPSGQKFVLDLKAMEPALRQRVPEAYAGAPR